MKPDPSAFTFARCVHPGNISPNPPNPPKGFTGTLRISVTLIPTTAGLAFATATVIALRRPPVTVWLTESRFGACWLTEKIGVASFRLQDASGPVAAIGVVSEKRLRR